MMKNSRSFLRYFPFWETLRRYDAAWLRFDLTAGMTVAVLAIPQVMVFALIAGVPPVQGLYAAILPTIVGAMFRSSEHIITGPSNATALMLATVLLSTGKALEGEALLETVLMLTFLVGTLQIGCGLLKLGDIFNFVSYAVTVGLTAGAGVLIAGNQIDKLLGLDLPRAQHFYGQVWHIVTHLGDVHGPTLIVGVLTLAGLLAIKRLLPVLPAELLMLICASLLVVVFHLESRGVRLIGEIPQAILPVSFVHDQFGEMRRLLTGALSLAILGMAEAVSIGKVIALSSGQRVDINQEFIGQGVANVTGSFFSCMTSSGSFSRSALNFKSGAKTRLAGVFSGLFVLMVVFFFAPYARYIPISALAAIVILVAYGMVRYDQIRLALRSTRADSIVFVVTFVSVLVFDLQMALYIGIALHALFFLKQSSQPRIRRLLPDAEGSFQEVPLTAKSQRPVQIIQFEGALFFGAERAIEEAVDKILEHDTVPQVVIFRMKRTRDFDANFIVVFSRILTRFRARKIPLIFCGVRPELQALFDRSGLSHHIKHDHLFHAEAHLFESTTEAVRYAYALLQNQGNAPAHPEAE
ncbi:STAS domain-containing protein [candidate division KSB3 bacterium]|uniref:STAS domain-containing protein n=1 Tax=candidate division KSB3 bacterium TaxID=2044937 RepID=A0A9D5JU91_9BACT|nr:STAS domain-containing protein [candidate division KSB3 bacterium]MBD3324260.1 STAS domain-containing protein [candidate division KSB3 bacterium]